MYSIRSWEKNRKARRKKTFRIRRHWADFCKLMWFLLCAVLIFSPLIKTNENTECFFKRLCDFFLLFDSILARIFAEKIVSVWIVLNKHIAFIWLVYDINQQIKQLPFPMFKFKWRNKKLLEFLYVIYIHFTPINDMWTTNFWQKIYGAIITI